MQIEYEGGENLMIKRLLVLFAVLALFVAACGGESATDETTTTTTSGDTTETTTATTQGGGDDVGQGSGEGILAAVKARGVLKCGVSGAATAFSEQQADGSMTGFDADYCRYVAAAVLGDANAVEFTALTAAERFTAVQTGAVDVLIRNTTWTQSRDTDVGMDFAPTTYYDGQQVMAREADGFTTGSQITDLEGAVVCTNAGTTTEKNISEVTTALGVSITLQTFEDYDQVMEQFLAGSCDAVTTDGSGLVGRKAIQESEDRDGSAWVIFPSSPISKEPLGPVTAQNDSQWLDVVKWSVFSSIIFDEKGVTSANAADMAANPPDEEVARLLGGDGELQTSAGLDPAAWLNAVSQVGNYDEIFARNLNPVGLFREGSLNASFLDGGLIYAPPAR
jgi:general L-amino acid transport system substrate-binding protein